MAEIWVKFDLNYVRDYAHVPPFEQVQLREYLTEIGNYRVFNYIPWGIPGDVPDTADEFIVASSGFFIF